MALTKVIGAGVGNLDELGVGTASPSYKVHSVTTSGSDYAGFFHNSSGSGNGTSLVVKGGANNTGAGTFIVQDYSGNTDLMVDGNGHVTMPNQSAFLVNPSSTQTNLTVNDWNTIAFGTERFDQNADFASNTFTSPVTGRYQFNLFAYLKQINHGYSLVQVALQTSNLSYRWTYDFRYGDHNADYMPLTFSTLADMDANDIAYIRIYVPNYGSAQMDFDAESWFSGYLVC